MALKIRFTAEPGWSLSISVERLADGIMCDFTQGGRVFTKTPAEPLAPIQEYDHPFRGKYGLNLDTPVGTWSDGAYCVCVHDRETGVVLPGGIMQAVLRGGEEVTEAPPGRPPGRPGWPVHFMEGR